MRITSGFLGGRIVKVPTGIRPTQERVREALFSSLGGSIVDACFLDLFAGSGAVGLEAYSRGAANVVWVEQNARAYKTLTENVQSLSPQLRDNCYCCEASSFLAKKRDEAFNIIFADPPYDKGGQMEKLLLTIEKSTMLTPNCLLVFEQGPGVTPPDLRGWTRLKTKRYGETQLFFYTRD